jgi:hypothetical protein
LVAIPWLIQEIGQRKGGVDLQEVDLGLVYVHHAVNTKNWYREETDM